MSVDVVIPVHNGWEWTRRCLQHLARQTLEHHVIVSDNGSTDGTPDRLRAEFPEVDVVSLGANLGFPAACNRGVAAGTGSFVVLLNNDVSVRPDFLERLLASFARDERLGSAAALLVSDSGKIESFGLAVDVTLAGYPRLRGAPPAAAVADARSVLCGPSGAAGAFRRRAWEDVGGLDEGVFAYGEDVDLALRLRSAGWRTAEVADAVATHAGSATAVVRSSWQRYQAGFSRGHFLRRYGVLRRPTAVRALFTEAVVVAGDAIVYSRDLAALRGRVAGWRAAAGRRRRPWPPSDTIDDEITFTRSLAMRRAVYEEGASPL